MIKHFWKSIEGWLGDTRTYRIALDRAKTGDHYVELGVFKGRSAAFMATEIANRGLDIKFDAIDHFRGSKENGDLSATLYDDCVKNLEPVKGYVNIIKMDSLEAVNTYEDNSLAFVFIDASHDYESALADMRAWYPKVKSGGMYAGDDYSKYWPGVIKAIKQFSKEIGVEYYVIPENNHWVMFKP